VPDADQFACKRQGADGGFATWRGDLRHTRRVAGVPGEWGLRLGWQLASQPLVPSEQYVVGGVDTVRGYLEAAASGDNGVLGSFEWRSPPLLDPGAHGIAMNGLLFVDGSHTNLIDVAAGQSAGTSLVGAGMGLRVRAAPTWSGAIDLAWPLRSTGTTPSRDAQFYLRLAGQF
jgi:hemolysin activation/secretion protein